MDKIQKKVICIGSTGKDIFFPVSSGTVVETGEKSNKTKQFCFNYGGKVHVEDRFSALGGCACNVSVGLSRLGVDVSALGYVGNDTDGMWIKETLLKEGVKTGDIKFLEEYNTDLSVVIVDANAGERTIFVNRDVGEKLRLVKNDVNGFDWCFIGSLYGDDIEYNMKVVHGELKEKNIKLAYNPGGKNIKQEECVVLDLIHHASIVFVNKSEAREIVSKFNLSYNEEELSQEVKLMSIIKEHMSPEDGIVVLTHGQKGAWAYDGKDVYYTKTIDKPVQDATGAGDAFASGFFAGILHGHQLEKSMQWGSINGDSVVEYYGAQKGLKRMEDIEETITMFPVEIKQ